MLKSRANLKKMLLNLDKFVICKFLWSWIQHYNIHFFQVARCTKIINADSEDPKYIINVKQFAKFVVDLADSVAPTDIEEGMRVG